jgi:hypothetical protein
MSEILMFDNMFNATESKHSRALLLSVGWVISKNVESHVRAVNPVTHLLMEV